MLSDTYSLVFSFTFMYLILSHVPLSHIQKKMVLSLIATVFLPATFLTGVFGMNFTVDGGFTIPLVNKPYGPFVFYFICTGLFVCSCLYFFSMGWIELYPIYRYFLKCCCGKRRVVKWEEDGKLGKVTDHRISTVYSPDVRSAARDAAAAAAASSPPLSPMGTMATEYAASSMASASIGTTPPVSSNSFADFFGHNKRSNSLYQEAMEEEMRRAELSRRKRGQVQHINNTRKFRHSSYMESSGEVLNGGDVSPMSPSLSARSRNNT